MLVLGENSFTSAGTPIIRPKSFCDWVYPFRIATYKSQIDVKRFLHFETLLSNKITLIKLNIYYLNEKLAVQTRGRKTKSYTNDDMIGVDESKVDVFEEAER